MKKHCFILALRDEAATTEKLEDYSISSERSPYRGATALVHSGYHHNIVLCESRYFVVPHGKRLDPKDSDLKAFTSLNHAVEHLKGLREEQAPYPIQIRSLKRHNLIRYKNLVYLCPHGREVNFDDNQQLSDLSVMDSFAKWESLISMLGESGIESLEGQILDLIDDVCIVKTKNGLFEARQLERGEPIAVLGRFKVRSHAVGELVEKVFGRTRVSKGGQLGEVNAGATEGAISAASLEDVVKQVSAGLLMKSMGDTGSREDVLFRHEDGRILRRVSLGSFEVQQQGNGAAVSTHADFEKAWREILG
jgi:hypothetical protein